MLSESVIQMNFFVFKSDGRLKISRELNANIL